MLTENFYGTSVPDKVYFRIAYYKYRARLPAYVTNVAASYNLRTLARYRANMIN